MGFFSGLGNLFLAGAVLVGANQAGVTAKDVASVGYKAIDVATSPEVVSNSRKFLDLVVNISERVKATTDSDGYSSNVALATSEVKQEAGKVLNGGGQKAGKNISPKKTPPKNPTEYPKKTYLAESGADPISAIWKSTRG